ncbi:MAG: ZIP family metal transporter [Christensenellaceae bacterium]|nr:ZIP family metal transporter [Christensenellaceae bacterium]
MVGTSPIMLAFLGTAFTCLTTVVGSAAVLLFKKEIPPRLQQVFLGFAAGVMIAASVWSLLVPAMELAAPGPLPVWVPAAGGVTLGVGLLLAMDRLLPGIHAGAGRPAGLLRELGRSALLVLAVTLHNIPEGMAVGMAFAAAGAGEAVSLSGAVVLAVGIGLQNLPEGAAISLPLKKEGLSAGRAFAYGAASGVAEPVAGVLGALLATSIGPLMPWVLAFAAGAMVYVTAEELIPAAHDPGGSHGGALGACAGFLLMMVMDVALG